MAEPHMPAQSCSTSSIPCKVWNADRTVKKSVVVSSFEALTTKGKVKLGLAESEEVTVVLEEDGTEVDDADYFKCLNANTTFIFLVGQETWKHKGKHQANEDEPDFMGMVVTDSVVSDSGADTTEEKLVQIAEVLRGSAEKVITLSNQEMEVLSSADQQHLANLMGIGFREAGRIQLNCHRYLDDRTQALDAISLLKTCKHSSNKRPRTN